MKAKLPSLIISIFAFSITANVANAETLPIYTEGRVFVYDCIEGSFINNNGYYPNGNVFLTVRGDTLIEGKMCKVVWFADTIPAFAAYETEGKLYTYSFQYSDGNPRKKLSLAVDFEAAPGDMTDDMRTLETGSVVINGKTHKTALVSGPEHYGLFIENVGPLTDFPAYFSLYDSPWVSCDTDWLSQINENGRMVYKREDFYPDVAWHPMVRDDRVWVYGGVSPDGSVYKSYCRFGEETGEINCRFYRPFYEFRREIWEDPSATGEPTVTSGGSFTPALMRERTGIVYMKAPEGKSVNPDYPDGSDLDIYTFMREDGRYPSTFNLYGVLDMECTRMEYTPYCQWGAFMHYKSYGTTVGGEPRRAYRFNDLVDFNPEFVESVGITSQGFLPYMFDPELQKADMAPRLLDYCDASGNVIQRYYEFKDVQRAAMALGTDFPTADTESCHAIYDLFGRKVTDPKAGTVYIRDGKKFVAR